jgi:Domain of unknown function (DUF6438)
MIRAPALAFVLLTAACAPRKPAAPPSDASSGAAGTAGAVVTLERKPCFGGCPVYRISVSREGLVAYEGQAGVRHTGAASKRIAPEQVTALVSELERAGYFSFAPSYTPAEPVCGRYATDLPAAVTSVSTGNRTHRVEHDYGCSSAPGGLVVLEGSIDEALGSAEWTGR